MTTISKGIISKKVKFQGKDLSNEIAQVKVFVGNGKKINLILNNEIVLRIGIKKEEKDAFLDKTKADSLKKFKLLIPKNNSILRNMLISEVEIRSKINKDKSETIDRPKSDEKDFLGSIERRGKEISEAGKKLGIDSIKIHKEFYCDRCCGFRTGRGLVDKKEVITCLKCHNILSTRKVSNLPTNVFSYLNGFWLEDYTANVLDSMGWTVWSSPTLEVYGVSGCPHQIDVLAIKNGRILIVECKSGEFNQNHLKNMLAKYYDIRCHHALAISIAEMHPDAKKIIEKNPAIKYCDNIGTVEQIKKVILKL